MNWDELAESCSQNREIHSVFSALWWNLLGKSAASPFRLEHQGNFLVLVFVKYGGVIASGTVLWIDGDSSLSFGYRGWKSLAFLHMTDGVGLLSMRFSPEKDSRIAWCQQCESPLLLAGKLNTKHETDSAPVLWRTGEKHSVQRVQSAWSGLPLTG